MAFTPEDGTGLDAATSLVSLSFANAYWSERPSTAGAWATATDGAKQEALMAASRDLDAKRWKGSPLSGTQGLALPRYWPEVHGRTWGGLPLPILEACCELAKRHLTDPLNKSYKRGGAVQSVQLGPLGKSFFPGAPSGTSDPYVGDLIDAFLELGEGQAEAVLA